jgi:hypothetical protein
MKSLGAIACAVLLLLAPTPGHTRGGHGAGGGHGGGMAGHPAHGGGSWGHASPGHPVSCHRTPRVFIGGGFGFPFFWPAYSFGYDFGPAYPYGDDLSVYPFPGTYVPGYPPGDWGAQSTPTDAGSLTPDNAELQDDGSYGLVQLHGVPDGATVYLDGRFWLVAHGLDGRWLALAGGSHAIAVRLSGYQDASADVDIVPGSNRVVEIRLLRTSEDRHEVGGSST